MKFQFKSIATRLTVWFLAVFLLAIFLIMAIIYKQRADYIREDEFNKLIAIRDLKVIQLNNWFDERMGDVEVISSDYEIRGLEDVFNGEDKDEEAIIIAESLIKRYKDTYPAFYDISIINPITGEVEISTDKNLEGADRKKNLYFTEPLKSGEIYIKDLYHSKTIGRPAMAFSAPVYGLKNKNDIIAVLVCRIDLEKSLYKLLENWTGMGETGETLIVNKDVIALNELRWHDDAPLKLKITAEPAVNAAAGETGIIETTDYRGEKILAAYTYLERPGWGFVAKEDQSEIYKPIKDIFRDFIIIMIVSAIIISFLTVLLAKSMISPVREISEVSKRIEKGDFSARTGFSRTDEIGVLADSIDSMALALNSRIMIQKGVAELTGVILEVRNMEKFPSLILNKLLDLTDSELGAFYMRNKEGKVFENIFSSGLSCENHKAFRAKKLEGELGTVLRKKTIISIKDIPSDTIFSFKTTAGTALPREIVTIPLLIKDKVKAVISIASIKNYSKEKKEMLKQFWPVLNTAFANLSAGQEIRLMAEEMKLKNIELKSQAEELQSQSEELYQQNLQLDLKKREVEEANRMKSEFVSNMSHELRTPLNSVIALSRVLLMQAKEKISKEEVNYLEVIERNGKHLLGLINDILDLSKIEAGKSDVRAKLFSLSSLIENICENLEAIAEEKGISIKHYIDEDVNHIESDELMVHKVLENLIGNALKFTEEGTVTVSARKENEKLIISVTDTGIGISKENLSHIFEEFRQVDGTASRKYEGTGLGLAIAYKTSQILGGTISVTSTPGRGSSFTLILPIKWSHKSLPENREFSPSFIDFPYEENKKTILVVDDDPTILGKISGFLSTEGYSVITASHGKEALKLAREYVPYAITLDLLMPEMDGFEVLEKLKRTPETSHIPVIVISVTDESQTAYALGAAGYITKPVEEKRLIGEIYKVMDFMPELVMVVDDNEIDRLHVSKILEEKNIKICEAETGKDCIELLKEKDPDILILDLMMPEMDGFKVLENLRGREGTKKLPVIVVTAKDLTEKEKLMLSENVSSVMAKSSLEPYILLDEIRRCLGEVNSYCRKRDKKRLLLVEDNKSAIIQVTSVLKETGFETDVAEGGEEALKYLKNNVPDGIILDLMMPEIDGFQVLQAIRNNPGTGHVPVLILTAKDLTPEELKTLRYNNIQQLIQKGDINKEELLEKIDFILKNKSNLTGKSNKKSETNREEIKINNKEKAELDEIKSILIVEDNPDNMVTIKAILQNKYEILEALDGREGLHMVKKYIPSLVLLDMALPEMDGFSVVKEIRKDKNIKDIPVIAITAGAMKGDRERILAAGCYDYISKPVDPLTVLEKIEKWLGE